jgi:O-antigen/teichoic acid export membrane protein
LLVARTVEPAGFAIFTAVLGILTIGAVVLQALQWAIAKLSADYALKSNSDALGDLIALWLPWVLIFGVVLAPASVVSAIWLGLFSDNPLPLAASLGFGVIATAPLAFEYGVLQGLAKYGWFAVANVSVAVARLAVGGLLLAFGGGVSGALFGVAAANLLGACVGAWPLRTFIRRPRATWTGLPAVPRETRLFSVTAIAFLCSAILLNVDTVVSPALIGTREAAIYAAAATLVRPIRLIAAFGSYLVFQYTTRARANGSSASRPLAIVSAVIVVADMPFAALVFVDPEFVLSLTVGAGYANAGDASRVYLCAAIVQSVVSLAVVSFVARDKTWITVALAVGILFEAVGAVVVAQSAMGLAAVVLVAAVVSLVLGLAPLVVDWIRQKELGGRAV